MSLALEKHSISQRISHEIELEAERELKKVTRGLHESQRMAQGDRVVMLEAKAMENTLLRYGSTYTMYAHIARACVHLSPADSLVYKPVATATSR